MSKTLLLADDSVVIQKLVGLSFANEDVQLITTDNGDDALAKAREARPDAVLADVVMPGMSGYEVCEAIKKDPALAHIPVLLLTGTFEAFDEARSRQVGSNGHITKPFEAQALVARVAELFEEAAARATTSPTPAASEALSTTAPNADDMGADFFDDGVTDLAGADDVALDVTNTAAPGALADSGFAFGGGGDLADDDAIGLGEAPELEPAQTPVADLLDDALEVEVDAGGDQTIALIPDDPINPPAGADPSLTTLALDDAPDLDEIADSTSVDDEGITVLAEDGFPSELADAAPSPLTTVIVSDGETSSDGLSIDATSPEVADLDDLADSAPEPIRGLTDPARPPSVPRPTSGAETVLADDLFEEASPVLEPPAVDPVAAASASEDSFAFGLDEGPTAAPTASEPDLGASRPPLPPPIPDPEATVIGDLADTPAREIGDRFADPATPPPVSADDLFQAEPVPSAPEPSTAEPVDDEMLAESMPHLEPFRAEEPARAASGEIRPDISPMMRDRIHETLERVAWEAFADLSETLVKQVLERVESIAWEVIPQMAEALVKEEIRRMKGEDEE